MEDTRQCCNPFPCPYIGKDKTCEECNCYRDDYWNEDERQVESEEKMTHIEVINNVINEFIRQLREYREKTLAEIIQKYDFIVGSKECKHKLMEILPEGANIICSPYIESPTTIYAIKKFDTMDLLIEP